MDILLWINFSNPVLFRRKQSGIHLFSVLSMKKFLRLFGIFILLPAVTYLPFSLFILPSLLERNIGPNVKQQITHSFENALSRDFAILILGNSRLYRGLNPDVFSRTTYNFAHDNDSFNQAYYKLRYLYTNDKEIEILILGIDYFQFGHLSDSRNYMYGPLLGENYMNDYPTQFEQLNYYLSLLNPKKVLHIFNKNELAFLKDNGQYIKPGKAKKDNYAIRSAERIDLQIYYFEKILGFCRKHNIQVILVMPPVRENEIRSYPLGEIKEFNNFLRPYISDEVRYFNFSTDESFDYTDYTDLTHLNENAANRFSEKLNDSIRLFLNKSQ